MIKDIIIIDDIFDDPDSIVDFAKKLDYKPQGEHSQKAHWVGLRSESIRMIDKEFQNKLAQDVIFKSLANTMGYNKKFIIDVAWDSTFYFHQLMASDKYNDSWIHVDPRLVYAGVVYLSKESKPDSGTFLIKDDGERVEIDNKYNRLVLYRSDYFHAPQGGFGESIDDSRLTLTMFFQELQFILRHPDNTRMKTSW